MTEETGAQHAELPQSGEQARTTPRKVNPDGGSIKQTKLRNKIARHMCNEMLVCSVDGFLEKLAPFSPDAQWVDSAYHHLKKERLLGTSAETALPVEQPERRNTRNSVQAGLVAGAGDTGHGVDPQNADTVQWERYRNMEPQQMDGTEMSVFKHLEKIVKAIQDCPDPNPNSKRRSNGYRYNDCPSVEMKSEIPGANFKVDAVIDNPAIYNIEGKAIPLAAAQTAVVIEFKKSDKDGIVYENRKQLVAAANHIMNDDPRRNWMYGITIENTDMSLWYFSRSYSMKSAPFNFTKDFKTFIHVFLSFLYANDEELGHDPSISRELYDEKWCYVYEMATEVGPKYYRTVESLYNSRPYCITGRKSRVWKVIEVAGKDNLAPKLGEGEVVLKDCWVDPDSLSEKEIQQDIFDRLKDVKEADYAWAPSDLRGRLKAGLAHPGRYFMKALWDSKLRLNKEKPKSNPEPNLLSVSVESFTAVQGNVIPSTQTPTPTVYPSSHASNAPTPVSKVSEAHHMPRDYKVKQHYRIVYADVGESLAYAKSLSDAVTAFEDIFIALTLLFLAGWVHRDVSEGNIILVRGKDGVRAKLSDLEYARFFSREDGAVSTDPKTGTPYFMPIEIHNGRCIFTKGQAAVDPSIMDSDDIQDSQQTDLTTPPPRHNFAHDLESLWWIMVWILLVRIKCVEWLLKMVFVVQEHPTRPRQDFFMGGNTLHTRSKDLMHKTLRDCRADRFLAIYNHSLCKFYENGERQVPTSYHNIYSTVWDAMELFIRNVSGISMELKDPTECAPRGPGPWIDPEEHGKRMRPADYVSDREDGSSRKRQKSGGEVLIDTDEEDTAAEDMVRDMAGIIRQDSNPRIRTTWD